MSFQAQLILEGEAYNVQHCNFQLSQAIDRNHEPVGVPRGGLIHLTVEADEKTDLYNWMASPTSTKSGKITFYKRDQMKSKMRELEFENAFCVEYEESFNAVSPDPMTISFTASAQKIKMNQVSLENKWGS